jgi:serine O-acetyltransferase
MASRRARFPGFVEAVRADMKLTLAYRAERVEITSDFEALQHALRLMWVSDAFLGQVLYRAKASLQARGVPFLPRLCHRLAMMVAQVCIGDPVIVAPGIYLAHGQVVIDGVTEVETGAVFFPWVTVGLRAGNFNGPTIGAHAKIGTGAKVVGNVRVGAHAEVGANAVVVTDVPDHSTAVGVPAQVVRRQSSQTQE